MTRRRPALALCVLIAACAALPASAATQPIRSRTGIVVCEERLAARAGADVLREGGNAVDAAVATAFALAVTMPKAGNLGGGGFMVTRTAEGDVAAFDFREMAPAASRADMWLTDGAYDKAKHHDSIFSVGVPGTVAGLHLAWREGGTLPWARLLRPAIALAREGIPVTSQLARDLIEVWPEMQKDAASVRQFSRDGAKPLDAGDTLRQPDLARTLERISRKGPKEFYEGETAGLIVAGMKAAGGPITREDLAAYEAKRRTPVRGTYRGLDVIGMPPPSSGGTAVIEILNILEGWDLKEGAGGYGSALAVHRMSEAMRRAFADRARVMGDPDFNPGIPVAKLLSKEYAAELRKGVAADKASVSSPAQAGTAYPFLPEPAHTTHLSVVDKAHNAVSLTCTLEDLWGSKITVPGAGFLLNNEMGDFNAAPGLTDEAGKIGTPPNVAAPRKRMLSSMSPTILAKNGRLFMVTGSPGGRSIINTVVETIVNVVDFGMNAQEAVDVPRFHHQWLPDRILMERPGLSTDTRALLGRMGHTVAETNDYQGVAAVIVVDAAGAWLEGAQDRRNADSAAAVPEPARP